MIKLTIVNILGEPNGILDFTKKDLINLLTLFRMRKGGGTPLPVFPL